MPLPLSGSVGARRAKNAAVRQSGSPDCNNPDPTAVAAYAKKLGISERRAKQSLIRQCKQGQGGAPGVQGQGGAPGVQGQGGAPGV